MSTFTNVACVGMHFRGAAAVQAAAALSEGDALDLRREPDNAYDSNAIQVYLEDLHLGYVERDQAAWIAPLIDDGGTAEATVTSLEQRGKNIHPILTIEAHP